MTSTNPIHRTRKSGTVSRLAKRCARLWNDRSGVGAIEFALIAPLLLMLYITAFELTIGLSVSKRLTKASGTIADLVSQQETSVDPAFLGTMKDVAASILVPYNTNDISISITGIELDGGANPKASWSWSQSGEKPYAAGSAVPVPDNMKIAGSFLIHAELAVPHQLLMVMPGLLPSEVRDITIRRDYYFQTRTGKPLPCPTC